MYQPSPHFTAEGRPLERYRRSFDADSWRTEASSSALRAGACAIQTLDFVYEGVQTRHRERINR
jgi:hypothetical protein